MGQPRRKPPHRTIYVLLFALALAMAYLVGMHEERGRQKLAQQKLRAAVARLSAD